MIRAYDATGSRQGRNGHPCRLTTEVDVSGYDMRGGSGPGRLILDRRGILRSLPDLLNGPDRGDRLSLRSHAVFTHGRRFANDSRPRRLDTNTYCVHDSHTEVIVVLLKRMQFLQRERPFAANGSS